MKKADIDMAIREYREKCATRRRLSSSSDDFESALCRDRDHYSREFAKDPLRFIETVRNDPSHGAVLFYGHFKFVVRDAFDVLYRKGTDRSSVQFLRDAKALMRHPDADAVWSLFEQHDPEVLAAVVVILFKTSKKERKHELISHIVNGY